MKIEAVVLAAGYSSRAGTFKLELDINGKTVIERCLEGLNDFCSRIIVVGGYRIDKIRAILKNYPKVEVVLNNSFNLGMFSSVKTGLRHLQGERFFFTPGDYPLISRNVCQKLLQADGDIVIPVFNGRKGHPLLLKTKITAELLKEDDGYNLRDFIRRQGFVPVTVEDEGILWDLDTREDYQKILARLQGGGFHE
ncbi:MAG: nucleotidyltransferase family protein [Bacillota bacterium]